MSIHHEMQTLVTVMSADDNIRVVLRGDQAYAEPGLCVLPAPETIMALDVEDAYRLMQAFADHEFGHAIDTDLVLFGKLAEKNGAAYGRLLNVCEDGYIEGRRGMVYPGARFNLRKKNEWFWGLSTKLGLRPMVERIAKPDSMWEAFLLACSALVRPWGRRSTEEIYGLNPDLAPLLAVVQPELDKIETLYHETKQTAEVAKITDRIMELLKEFAEKLPPKKKDSEETEEGAHAAARAVTIDLKRFEEGKGELPPMDPEGALQVLVRRIFEMPDETRPYIVFDPTFDIERDFSKENLANMTREYDNYAAEAAQATDSLVYAFEAAMRAKREKRPVFGADDNYEIDTLLLGEYSVGALDAEDLYVGYAAEDDENACCAVLIDCSGSMGYGPGSASHLARMCGIAMHEALKRTQIPHEICGFTTLSSNHLIGHTHFWARGLEEDFRAHFRELRKACVEAEARGTDLSKFARTAYNASGDLLVPIYGTFKNFDSDDGRGLVYVNGLAQNLDGEAVLWQARRLAQRPERRRVMFIMSDGYPAGSHDNAQGARYLCDAVERVIAAGIEVYGLGIMSDAVQEFYPTWWVCHNLDDLCDLAMNALTETMARTRVERRWVDQF